MIARCFLLLCMLGVFVLPAQAQTPVLVEDVPASNFINEGFCFDVTITDSGGPGYGPYIRLILPLRRMNEVISPIFTITPLELATLCNR